MQSLLVLGRQPNLGLAEVESLYGSGKISPIGRNCVVVDVDPCLLAFDRLGGAIKFCKVLTTIEGNTWKGIEKFLLSAAPQQSQTMPEGKMQLGLSVIGIDVSLKQLEASGLSIKKAIRKTGRSVRLIPNKELELNSAQVIHNHLTGPLGWELVIIRSGDNTVIAQTVKVQDIDAYTRRDRERPKRDTKIGMLPPKLAQIIINLASGKIPEEALSSICDIPANEPIPRKILSQTVLDPFCGTGVVLQEAILMGYSIMGTDLEPRMIDYSLENLDWLNNYHPPTDPYDLVQGDATNFQWKGTVDLVASETYLGRPFTAMPSNEVLAQTVAECNLILKKFLRNIQSQVEPGTRFCLAIPAWQIRPNQFKQLPLIDQIEEMGYNRVSFEHVGFDQLTYYRPDQIVARQLIVITRK